MVGGPEPAELNQESVVISDVKEDSVTVEIARVKGGARVEVEVARTGLASVSKPGIVEAGDDDQKKGGDGS